MTNIRQGVTYIQQYLIRLFSLTELDTPTEPPMPKIYDTDGLSGEYFFKKDLFSYIFPSES